MNNKHLFLFIIHLLWFKAGLCQSFLLVKDPAIHKIVPENATIDRIAEGFMFTEGPVWSKKGYLLFSDIPADRIYRWDEANGVSIFLYPSGKTNGLFFDQNGDLLMCQHEERQIAKYTAPDSYQAIINTYNGKRFNSPNDLVIKRNGAIYFTDPAWGLPEQEKDLSKEIPYQGIFKFEKGTVTLLDETVSSPNGIIFSPDEKWLYVANLNKQTNEKNWLRYRVIKDGTLKGKKIFADATASLETGSPDGMTVDEKGNLYFTGPGGILIYDDGGTYLGLIRFPELPSNVCFGNAEGKTLFVTARTSVYKINLQIKGSYSY